MGKGSVTPPEGKLHHDQYTGAAIRQVTSHPSTHHHPFFFVSPYDRRMQYLFFVSYRCGAPQIFLEERASRQLRQLTDRADLVPWSLQPSYGGDFVLFTTRTGAWRLDLETLEESQLFEFEHPPNGQAGMVGASMGTTTLSHDDRWWAIPLREARTSTMLVIDLHTAQAGRTFENESIGHPQFCPDDPNLIFYAGPMTDRLWIAHRDGRKNERLCERSHRAQWITHESWIPGTREVAFVDWPLGMKAIHCETRMLRHITDFPAWHAHADDSGRLFVCDTNFPDIGLHTFSAAGGGGTATRLCESSASSVGSHWQFPFPYNHGPVEVYAPQHTHPHPRFAPDASCVVFTSDKTGHAQIYECAFDNPMPGRAGPVGPLEVSANRERSIDRSQRFFSDRLKLNQKDAYA